jgi:hypothetical protein
MKSLIETAKTLQLDEKISPRNKVAMINLLNSIITDVESMKDNGHNTRTNIQTILKDYGGIEKLEDLLAREIDSR